VPRIPNSSENSEFSGRSIGQAGEKDFTNSVFPNQGLDVEGTVNNWIKQYNVSLNWIVILRVMMGLVFATTWASNLNKGLYGDGFEPFIQGWADGTDFRWYADFLSNVIIPNIEILRVIQVVTEGLLMGLFLTIGLFTPLSAAVAWFFVVNLFLASFGTGEWPWTYVMMGVLLAVIALTRAGRSIGVDAWLMEKRGEPRLPLY
jgi:uncharacterized membrane protein YphA (DoxX/SURF4 family)